MNTARALCLSCICVITIPAVHAQSRNDLVTETSRQSWSAWTNSGWIRLRVEYQGRFELTDDERDVKSVSPGGSLELTGRGWLSLFGRRYTVRGNPDGTVTRRYVVGAAERPLDGVARAWIAETLQSLALQGFAVEARITRILASEGSAGALNAASRLSSDFAKAEYLVTLSHAARFDDALISTFGNVSSTIGSDYEHARVLLEVLDTQSRTPALIEAVIGSAVRIGSDYEKARVFVKMIETQSIDASARQKIIDAAGTIGSDYERSRVLSALALH